MTQKKKIDTSKNEVKVAQAIMEMCQFACDLATTNLQTSLTSIDSKIDDNKRTILNEVVKSSIMQAFDKSIETVSSQISDLYTKKK